MTRFDFRIYIAHAAFWLAFAVGDFIARRRVPASDVRASSAPTTSTPVRAPGAALLLALHMVGFALMYAGVGDAVFGRHSWPASSAQRYAGALVIAGGALLAASARIAFASWRFRAQLDEGHQLATGGPFHWVRHPIYAALDLLAVGTALWIPNLFTIVGAIGMIIGSELRARAEEPLLEQAFGAEYRAYRARTKRFIPGIY